jgi:asparagine synthase (glutamine-hydrolysing)
MNQKIAHRGPDADAVMIKGALGMGHRRLSIIDLSPAGKQPMQDSSGRYTIVFNGEIYNFESIRAELKLQGISFQTRTDTEVILEAYKKWGVECLSRFNGMFAFALWDDVQQQLFIARDRLGKKPLFYQPLEDGGVIFASELKSLMEDAAVSRKINRAAFSHYLSLSYTLTAASIFEGVEKLPPAHYRIFKRGQSLQPIRYWNLAASFEKKNHFKNEEEAGAALRDLIDDAVRLRLISDVPLGAFLSGGVDSSTIVAAMCQIQSAQDVYSFSAGFQEKSFNEIEEARAVANALGVNHRDRYVLPDTADLIPKMVYHADEPFADTSIIPMYLLAEFARQYVTVSLSGDGGDEIFAGYETYAADKIHHLTRWIPDWATRFASRAAERWLPVKFDKVSWDYKLRQFLQGHAYDAARAHYHWRTIFSDAEKESLLTDSLYKETREADAYQYFRNFDEEVAGCHYLDRGMYVDIKTWLVDDILVKVDRSTMAHALEARAPFLDYRVVEFAASLPVNLKMKGFQKKYLLKKSQSGRLPDFVTKRRKQGFNAPVSHWLMTSLNKQYRDMTIREGEMFFKPEYIRNLWDEHSQKQKDNSFKLLTLINFLIWVKQYDAR